eukprot:2786093-Prymnesium_polylepis.1
MVQARKRRESRTVPTPAHTRPIGALSSPATAAAVVAGGGTRSGCGGRQTPRRRARAVLCGRKAGLRQIAPL